jgi:hypothetical protein
LDDPVPLWSSEIHNILQQDFINFHKISIQRMSSHPDPIDNQINQIPESKQSAIVSHQITQTVLLNEH